MQTLCLSQNTLCSNAEIKYKYLILNNKIKMVGWRLATLGDVRSMLEVS